MSNAVSRFRSALRSASAAVESYRDRQIDEAAMVARMSRVADLAHLHPDGAALAAGLWAAADVAREYRRGVLQARADYREPMPRDSYRDELRVAFGV